MDFSRRDFGKLALAGLPAAALIETPLFGSSVLQAKPNSLIKGIQIGLITYSYGGMPDQSGVATLKYIVESGISAVELMDGPAEQFAGRPASAARGGGGGGGGARPGGAPGGAPGAAPAAAAGAGAAAAAPPAGGGRPAGPPGGGGGGGRGGGLPEGAAYNGTACADLGRGGAGGARPGGAPGAPGGGGGFGGRGGAPMTPEEQAAAQAAAQEAATKLREWRTSVSMDKFKELRKMYNDAGVTIYAYKPDGLQKDARTTDGEWDYVFNVASVLGATHMTMELPPATDDGRALLKKLAGFADKHKVYAAFHTHGQGSMTVFDEPLAISKSFLCGVDLGHYVAAGNVGGDPIQFLQKYHDRMISFHLKDRTLPQHCSLNLAWGTGDTPIKDILQTVQKNKWTTLIPTIELEYAVPAGSDKVQEARKCMEYCKAALGA